MIKTPAYAAAVAKAPLVPLFIERREPGPRDVLIEILYCGVCHSDIHQVRDEWAAGIFPMVPGHEIVGRIAKVGDKVTRFKVGDLAGVGCFVDSCRECPECKAGLEQYCQVGANWTYNGRERDGKTPTYGGYSTRIVVDEQYTLHVSSKLPLEGVAPLLCAGTRPTRRCAIGKWAAVNASACWDWADSATWRSNWPPPSARKSRCSAPRPPNRPMRNASARTSLR